MQQQGEAGVSGVAAVCKMRSQRVVAQTAAQQAAATAAETVQCRKLTAFLKPTQPVGHSKMLSRSRSSALRLERAWAGL